MYLELPFLRIKKGRKPGGYKNVTLELWHPRKEALRRGVPSDKFHPRLSPFYSAANKQTKKMCEVEQ
jgi:hypothetical protein